MPNTSLKMRQRQSANTEKAMNPMNTNERILKVFIEIVLKSNLKVLLIL